MDAQAPSLCQFPKPVISPGWYGPVNHVIEPIGVPVVKNGVNRCNTTAVLPQIVPSVSRSPIEVEGNWGSLFEPDVSIDTYLRTLPPIGKSPLLGFDSPTSKLSFAVSVPIPPAPGGRPSFSRQYRLFACEHGETGLNTGAPGISVAPYSGKLISRHLRGIQSATSPNESEKSFSMIVPSFTKPIVRANIQERSAALI